MAISMVAVAKFMMWLTEKGTHVAITERFQDAEFILAHQRAPDSWQKPRPLFVRLMQGSGSIPWYERLTQAFQPEANDGDPQTYQLQRLDNLIDFFETCPFFQDEASREIMLDQLWDVREKWENISPESGQNTLEQQ